MSWKGPKYSKRQKIVSKIRVSNPGTYTCIAENSISKISKTVKVGHPTAPKFCNDDKAFPSAFTYYESETGLSNTPIVNSNLLEPDSKSETICVTFNEHGLSRETKSVSNFVTLPPVLEKSFTVQEIPRGHKLEINCFLNKTNQFLQREKDFQFQWKKLNEYQEDFISSKFLELDNGQRLVSKTGADQSLEGEYQCYVKHRMLNQYSIGKVRIQLTEEKNNSQNNTLGITHLPDIYHYYSSQNGLSFYANLDTHQQTNLIFVLNYCYLSHSEARTFNPTTWKTIKSSQPFWTLNSLSFPEGSKIFAFYYIGVLHETSEKLQQSKLSKLYNIDVKYTHLEQKCVDKFKFFAIPTEISKTCPITTQMLNCNERPVFNSNETCFYHKHAINNDQHLNRDPLEVKSLVLHPNGMKIVMTLKYRAEYLIVKTSLKYYRLRLPEEIENLHLTLPCNVEEIQSSVEFALEIGPIRSAYVAFENFQYGQDNLEDEIEFEVITTSTSIVTIIKEPIIAVIWGVIKYFLK